jgi:hypothetical protein
MTFEVSDRRCKPRHACKGRNEFVGKAVRKKLVVSIITQIRKGQHNDTSRKGRLNEAVCMGKFRNVASPWKYNSQRFISAGRLIILLELLPQARKLNAHDRICVRVIAWLAAKDRNSQNRFLQ